MDCIKTHETPAKVLGTQQMINSYHFLSSDTKYTDPLDTAGTAFSGPSTSGKGGQPSPTGLALPELVGLFWTHRQDRIGGTWYRQGEPHAQCQVAQSHPIGVSPGPVRAAQAWGRGFISPAGT